MDTLGASPGPAGAFLPALVNELNRTPVPCILLLDGYDGITEACQEQIAFLLAHTHRFFQLAVTTRAEPPLPLHRIRAAGEITEIGTTDLRLTPAQAQAVVHDVAKVRLRERDMASLLDRTEGWPTGVYLSALSLRGHPAAAPSPARPAATGTSRTS